MLIYKKKNFYGQAGLTLVEILVSVGIFLIITTLVWLFIKQSYFFQSFALEQTTSINEAQRGVETIVKELREAAPADTGAYAIERADNFELIFFSDYDRDIAVERVRYFLVGSEIKKSRKQGKAEYAARLSFFSLTGESRNKKEKERNRLGGNKQKLRN